MIESITDFIKLFFKPKEELTTFILIKETTHGVETFISPKMENFPDAYKLQIASFLEGALKSVRIKKERNKKSK